MGVNVSSVVLDIALFLSANCLLLPPPEDGQDSISALFSPHDCQNCNIRHVCIAQSCVFFFLLLLLFCASVRDSDCGHENEDDAVCDGFVGQDFNKHKKRWLPRVPLGVSAFMDYVYLFLCNCVALCVCVCACVRACVCVCVCVRSVTVVTL